MRTPSCVLRVAGGSVTARSACTAHPLADESESARVVEWGLRGFRALGEARAQGRGVGGLGQEGVTGHPSCGGEGAANRVGVGARREVSGATAEHYVDVTHGAVRRDGPG